MEFFYIYILKCSDGSYYTGHTDNLENRISEHQSGRHLGYTSSRLPVQLVFSELFESRDAAFKVEHQIKKWSRIKKEALINKDFKLLVSAAKSKS
jgi:predicted GIY-YIG superfamily endonuclease